MLHSYAAAELQTTEIMKDKIKTIQHETLGMVDLILLSAIVHWQLVRY